MRMNTISKHLINDGHNGMKQIPVFEPTQSEIEAEQSYHNKVRDWYKDYSKMSLLKGQLLSTFDWCLIKTRLQIYKSLSIWN